MAEQILNEEAENEDTQKGKFMTFKSGNEYYGIEIKYISEIIGIQRITKLPEVQDYIKGLINLRGSIIPVIDVRARFLQPPIEYDDRTCIIVIEVKSTTVGLIVEKIAEVVDIADENILPPPKLKKDYTQNKYVYGIGKVGDEVKLLLDPQGLIEDETAAAVEDDTDEENEN